MKKLLLFLIIFSFIFNAEARVQIDGVYYNLNDLHQTAEVTYDIYYSHSNYKDLSGPVVIPEFIEYNNVKYSVTSIGNRAV